MKNVNSVGSKKISGDTRSNWVTMMFVTKKRYRCFRKQSHIETCTERFRELEHLGFEFGEFGFVKEDHLVTSKLFGTILYTIDPNSGE